MESATVTVNGRRCGSHRGISDDLANLDGLGMIFDISSGGLNTLRGEERDVLIAEVV